MFRKSSGESPPRGLISYGKVETKTLTKRGNLNVGNLFVLVNILQVKCDPKQREQGFLWKCSPLAHYLVGSTETSPQILHSTQTGGGIRLTTRLTTHSYRKSIRWRIILRCAKRASAGNFDKQNINSFTELDPLRPDTERRGILVMKKRKNCHPWTYPKTRLEIQSASSHLVCRSNLQRPVTKNAVEKMKTKKTNRLTNRSKLSSINW